ncbi:hypothetical protein BDU57DRAFT_519230 [Ampelomyces quisqualis]|uniref:Uncharacterized protein n=1 Tax=Ampelomyces quisqualis TaxID=50730 RepID=A0A6A5QFP1_AMPQU|nr:hypothetical protein BDU57DRAFT_519230 [Ampelomyces quisqualis]
MGGASGSAGWLTAPNPIPRSSPPRGLGAGDRSPSHEVLSRGGHRRARASLETAATVSTTENTASLAVAALAVASAAALVNCAASVSCPSALLRPA